MDENEHRMFIQSGAFEESTYHFHICDTFGKRERHSYQEGTLTTDAGTKKG